MSNKEPRLAVIPSDPIEVSKSIGWASLLEEYYNPLHFFKEVYLLSPLEKEEKYEFGMHIIPTKPKQLKSRIKELNINVIRSYGGYWACDMACSNKVNGVPVVVSVHDTNPDLLYDSIKEADVVFCVSEAVRKLVSTKHKKRNRAWLLPNRVDFNIMRPYEENELKDLDDKYPAQYRILHVGRKAKQKNLDTVIKSLKILGSNYCLLAVGSGCKDEYVNLAKEQEVIEQCFFIESISNQELARYYSWADCMCTPSRWEGFGIVFIEALACEAVVVTSDIAPINEYMVHKRNGLLVKDYEDPLAIAKMIEVTCTDKQLRDDIKKNARNSVEMFEKRRIDELEVNYYKNILEMAQSGAFNMSFTEKYLHRLSYKNVWKRLKSTINLG
jgi:glycosyltransferase involved in cell wall biosynthesis